MAYLSTLIRLSLIIVIPKFWWKILLNILIDNYILQKKTCLLHNSYTTNNHSQIETQNWQICQCCQCCVIYENLVCPIRNVNLQRCNCVSWKTRMCEKYALRSYTSKFRSWLWATFRQILHNLPPPKVVGTSELHVRRTNPIFTISIKLLIWGFPKLCNLIGLIELIWSLPFWN